MQSACINPISPVPTHRSDRWRAVLPTSCGYFSTSCLCSFLFFLVPPAAATLKSSPPCPTFPMSFHGLLHHLVLIDSLPALFKLALGLGQVRVPPPPYPFVVVSCPRANASLLCKGCTIPFSHNGCLCVHNPSTEASEQTAYHTNFACVDYSIRMTSQQGLTTSTVKALLWSVTRSISEEFCPGTGHQRNLYPFFLELCNLWFPSEPPGRTT